MRLYELHLDEDDDRFFSFRGVKFDSWLEETERYVFYGIPFLKQRLVELKTFSDASEINAFIAPFAKVTWRWCVHCTFFFFFSPSSCGSLLSSYPSSASLVV